MTMLGDTPALLRAKESREGTKQERRLTQITLISRDILLLALNRDLSFSRPHSV